MSASQGLTRRRFVQACAALSLAVGMPGCRPRRETLATARGLTAHLVNREEWLAVGAAHLASTPQPPRLEDLVTTLAKNLGWSADQDGDLASRLGARIRDEFEAGRTTLVEGWLLAESEVRMAAVVALIER